MVIYKPFLLYDNVNSHLDLFLSHLGGTVLHNAYLTEIKTVCDYFGIRGYITKITAPKFKNNQKRLGSSRGFLLFTCCIKHNVDGFLCIWGKNATFGNFCYILIYNIVILRNNQCHKRAPHTQKNIYLYIWLVFFLTRG